MEIRHFAAGVGMWRNWRFDLLVVNPPLVRMWATWPAAIWGPKDIPPVSPRNQQLPARGPSFDLALFLDDYWGTTHYDFWLRIARLMCLPFSVLAIFGGWQLANELFGPRAGWLAGAILATLPTVGTWSVQVNPDWPCAALLLWAHLYFIRWRRRGSDRYAALAGCIGACAVLAKTTNVLLIGSWVVLLIIPDGIQRNRYRTAAESLTLTFFLWITILTGYGFSDVGKPIGDFHFNSRVFAGAQSLADGKLGGNRLRGTILEAFPFPAPAQFWYAFDAQKSDFEQDQGGYLFGKTYDHPVWYYYIAAMLVKEPLSWWFLVVIGSVSLSLGFQRSDLWLLVPILVFAVCISQLSGFSRHYRYWTPVIALLSVMTAGALRGNPSNLRKLMTKVCVLLIVIAHITVIPYSHSYFNALVGGPRGGFWALSGSCVDWGEDFEVVLQHARKLEPPVMVCTTPTYVERVDTFSPGIRLLDINVLRESISTPSNLHGHAIVARRLLIKDPRLEEFLRPYEIGGIAFSHAVYQFAAANRLGVDPLKN
jgi:hypothetical protein